MVENTGDFGALSGFRPTGRAGSRLAAYAHQSGRKMNDSTDFIRLAFERIDGRGTRSQRRLIRNVLRQRDGDLCCWCKERMDFPGEAPRSGRFVTIEHLVPRCGGGSDQLDNLALAHLDCNRGRNAKAQGKPMNRKEISQAAQDIAHDICSNPFDPEWEIARKAAKKGIERGLQVAVDAEQTKVALAQIDAAFAQP